MRKLTYKCVICGQILEDRTKMKRLVVQVWDTKGYGSFKQHKIFDLCNGCYVNMLKYAKYKKEKM